MSLFDRDTWTNNAGPVVVKWFVGLLLVGVSAISIYIWNFALERWNATDLLTEKFASYIEADAKTNSDIIKRIEDLTVTIDLIRVDVDFLKQPSKIIDVDPISGADAGYCLVPGPHNPSAICAITLVLHRTPQGAACLFVQDQTKYWFFDPDTERRRDVFLVTGGDRQVSTSETDVPLVVRTPRGFAGPNLQFFFKAVYTQCNGPDDNTEIAQTSRPISIPILTEPPK